MSINRDKQFAPRFPKEQVEKGQASVLRPYPNRAELHFTDLSEDGHTLLSGIAVDEDLNVQHSPMLEISADEQWCVMEWGSKFLVYSTNENSDPNVILTQSLLKPKREANHRYTIMNLPVPRNKRWVGCFLRQNRDLYGNIHKFDSEGLCRKTAFFRFSALQIEWKVL